MQIQSLVQGDTLGKEMATHTSILAGKSSGQSSLVGYRSHKESEPIWQLNNKKKNNNFFSGIVNRNYRDESSLLLTMSEPDAQSSVASVLISSLRHRQEQEVICVS